MAGPAKPETVPPGVTDSGRLSPKKKSNPTKIDRRKMAGGANGEEEHLRQAMKMAGRLLDMCGMQDGSRLARDDWARQFLLQHSVIVSHMHPTS